VLTMHLHIVPDPILRKRCQPVTRFDAKLEDLAARMLDLMRLHQGIGLAAPQVGILQRLVVMLMEDQPIVIANPVIDCTRGLSSMNEGCLSCPGVQVRIQRAALVVVEGQGLDGHHVSYRFDRVAAHCIQHEIEHLDGRLILDHGPGQPCAVLATLPLGFGP